MKVQEILILAIEKKYGSKISSYNKVKIFSKHLESDYKILISISTLRRFFKTVPNSSAPSENTLNNLSKYLGYSDYKKFLEHSYSYDQMRNQQTLQNIKTNQKVTNKNKQLILNDLTTDVLIIFIESLVQWAIFKKNFLFQRELLEIVKEVVEKKNIPYLRENLALLIWNILILEEKESFEGLIKNHKDSKIFQQFIIFSYIDYDQLNYRYGFVLERLKYSEVSSKDHLFICLILALRDHLNNKPIDELKWNKKINELPEILKGRYLSYQLLVCSKNNSNKAIFQKRWNEILRMGASSNSQNLYFIEILHTLLIMQRVDLIEIILNQFYEELFDISDGFTYLNRSIYLLAQSFVFNSHGNKKMAKSSISLIDESVIEKREFHLWFKLFYYISAYHSEIDKNTQPTLLKEYQLISHKLGFLTFNKSFCKDFFLKTKSIDD